MLRATLKNLAAHKLRLALTAISVVLGVAFMAGTFVLTDTIKHTFDALFAQTTVGKDVVVRATTPYTASGRRGGGFGADRPLVPESVLDTVRSVPGVRAASGTVSGQVTLLDRSGKALKKGAPTLAFAWSVDRSLSSLTLRSGRGPASGTEATVDSGTARDKHFSLGDRVRIISNQPPREFTVVGTTGFGKADNIAGATIVAFDTATAQELIGRPGYFADVQVAAAKGTSTTSLISAIGSKLDSPRYEAVTATSVAAESSAMVNKGLSFFNYFLLTFAGIALFVGAFLIFNTFSILVGQRTRELGLLRAIGASRSQVNRSVLGEALIVGLGGSIIGLAVGIPLAAGLYAALKALGLGLPSSALQLKPRTVVVSLLVGTVITMLSAILPARRAARIAPVAAMRADAGGQDGSLGTRAIAGGSVLAVGIVLLAVGLFAHAGLLAVAAGAAITFVGVAMLVPFVTAPLVAVIGAPLRLRGMTGRLSQENAARNPRRTAATASALMIGLAVVAAIATLGSSASASTNKIIDGSLKGDYVLTASGRGGGFSPAVEQVVRAAPGVVAVSPLRMVPWHDGSAAKTATGIDPVGGPQVLTLDMVSGSSASLGRGQLLVESKVAKDRHLMVGQTVHMGFPATETKPVVIGGTYKTNQFLGNYVISSQLAAENVTQVQDDTLFVKTTGASASEQAAVANAIAAYPNLSVKTASQFKHDQKSQLNSILTIVYVLLALSIIIALIGVVNTLALSVIERTREIGLLRSIGMQRRQIRRMIRGEAIVVSMLGAVLGLVLGIGLGAALVRALSSTGLGELSIPVSTIVAVIVVTFVLGVLAAVGPARRAARLDVLTAIAT